MVKEIKLTQGQVTIVDDEDFEELNQYKWTAHNATKKDKSDYFYAIRCVNKKMIRMHRVLMNPPDDMQIDHINRNPLDNRKENLRICTHSVNQRNRYDSKVWFVHGVKYDASPDAAKELGVSPRTIIRWCDGYINNKGAFIPAKPNCWSELKYKVKIIQRNNKPVIVLGKESAINAHCKKGGE